MVKEEAAPLSPVRRRLSPTKQRKDAPSSSEPRPLIVLLRFVCGSLCFMGGIGCLAAALPVILSAGHDLEIAQILSEHDMDFESAGQCKVTSVKECWYTTSDDQLPTAPSSLRDQGGLNTTCWRSFYALFKPPNATRYSRTFEAWPEFVLDSHETNCSEFDRYRRLPKGCQSFDAKLTPSGKFRTGISYECWRAARAGIDRRYQCQNQGTCYKINNPHTIAQRHIDGATRPLVFGGVLGVGGILLACLSFVVCSPLMRSKEGSAHHQVPTVPVAPPPEMIISGTRRKFNSDEKPPPEVDGPVPRAAPSERV